MPGRIEFKSGKLRLEGMVSPPKGEGPFPVAVVAHPHPLFGGSMDNNVVYALRDALCGSGFLTLCFNFRGVGKSRGSYGEIDGEAQDLVAACEFIRTDPEANPDRVIVCGYSFGGLVVLSAIAKGLKPTALILVSPMLPESGINKDETLRRVIPLRVPTLILSGGRDQFFRRQQYQPLLPSGGSDSKLMVIKSADHFWVGSEPEILHAVRGFPGLIAANP